MLSIVLLDLPEFDFQFVQIPWSCMLRVIDVAPRLVVKVLPDRLDGLLHRQIFSLELLFAGECHNVFQCVVSNSKSSSIFYHKCDIGERFQDVPADEYLSISTA